MIHFNWTAVGVSKHIKFLGLGPVGVSKLIVNEQVSSVINSYPGPNVDVLERMFDGRMRLEVLPQGSMTERIRAAGAGIPGLRPFYYIFILKSKLNMLN